MEFPLPHRQNTRCHLISCECLEVHQRPRFLGLRPCCKVGQARGDSVPSPKILLRLSAAQSRVGSLRSLWRCDGALRSSAAQLWRSGRVPMNSAQLTRLRSSGSDRVARRAGHRRHVVVAVALGRPCFVTANRHSSQVALPRLTEWHNEMHTLPQGELRPRRRTHVGAPYGGERYGQRPGHAPATD